MYWLKAQLHNLFTTQAIVLKNLKKHRHKFTPKWSPGPAAITMDNGNSTTVPKGENKNQKSFLSCQPLQSYHRESTCHSIENDTDTDDSSYSDGIQWRV